MMEKYIIWRRAVGKWITSRNYSNTAQVGIGEYQNMKKHVFQHEIAKRHVFSSALFFVLFAVTLLSCRLLPEMQSRNHLRLYI